MITRDKRIEYNEEEIACTVGNQAALITAKHYVNNPLACGARAGLASKMQVIKHPKGPTWIKMNGMDVNLGSSRATSRAVYNGLTSI
jgi:hypothetical protein